MTAQRIPVALQSVFLASNRGSEVFAAPPENAASKTFVRPPSVGMNGTTPRGNTRAKIRRFFSFNMGSKWPQPHERRYEIGSPVKSPAAKGFEPTTPRRTSSFEPPAMPVSQHHSCNVSQCRKPFLTFLLSMFSLNFF